MALLSEEQKGYISSAIETGKDVLHYAWVPFVVYLGWASSNPQPTLIKILSPLA